MKVSDVCKIVRDCDRLRDVWKKLIDRPIKENICKDCLTKFDIFTGGNHD